MKRRNKHNLSHYRLTTFQPGELIPVGCVEVLPGDSFDHTASVLLRCSPLLAPVMHRAMVRVHHFYVPNRITWPAADEERGEGWEQFITQAMEDGIDVPSFTFDQTQLTSNVVRLYEHLGCPLHSLAVDGTIEVSQLPARAYRAIWNEWYRDQDLQNPIALDEDNITSGIQRVCWRKDMFTAARTSPQYGDDVTLPIGISAPVVSSGGGAPSMAVAGGTTTHQFGAVSGNVTPTWRPTGVPPDATGSMVWNTTALETDLTAATGVSVNALREALALQRYAERLSQFGHRYPELLLSMGVKSSDGRLQRPEYLGGGKTMIQFSEVLQTSNGTAGPEDTVGSMYGHGISPGRTRKYRRFFEEHGYVISLISVVPEAVYANAIPRHFFKGFSGGLPQSPERLIDDYYQPELERIGQQQIFKKEIYPDGDSSDDSVFGYNDKYYEYRHQLSQVVGEFAPGRALDYWTWARSFASQPALNSSLVSCTPSNRIFADQSGSDVFWCAVNHQLVARRLVTNKTIGRTF